MKLHRPVVICSLILAIPLATIWLWHHPTSATRQAIESNYARWHTALAEQRTSDAYAIMAPAYRTHHSLEQFSEDFKGHAESNTRLQPNYKLRGFGPHAWLYPLEVGNGLQLLSGPDYEWVRVDGQWYLSGRYEYYLD